MPRKCEKNMNKTRERLNMEKNVETNFAKDMRKDANTEKTRKRM